LAGLGGKGEVLNTSSPSRRILHKLTDSWSTAEVLSQVHGEHVSRPVISDALVPPTDGLFGGSSPCVNVASQGRVGPEAEVNGHISIAFVDPQIFVWVEGIVKKVLKFVSED
jgi:hypothetical protein